MKKEPNDKQKELIETLDGFVVVDAGPGTGKTETLVSRYVNMIEHNLDPRKIMVITFTNNAANEMSERISGRFTQLISDIQSIDEDKRSTDDNKRMELLKNSIKEIRTSTFDALCLKIVQNSSDVVSDFFGTKYLLSRSASLVENETLNIDYFKDFYSKFVRENGSKYNRKGNDIAGLFGEEPISVYSVIQKLMSRGVIPKQAEWFGNGERIVTGSKKKVLKALEINSANVSDKANEVLNKRDSYDLSNYPDWSDNKDIPIEILEDVAGEDRFMLIEFIRDIYYAYICQSIRDNRLTFGLVALFAFTILYSDENARKMHSVTHMMVDEFQDTNELQMKICMMLLSQPNLCVVGDWKQGIYGFRYASIENITEFKDRCQEFGWEIQSGGVKLDIDPDEIDPKQIEFVINYRSSQLILDMTFECLDIPGSKEENVILPGNKVALKAKMDTEYSKATAVECIETSSFEEQVASIVDRISEYKKSKRYSKLKILDDGTSVETEKSYKDIAVLCRNARYCIAVLRECAARGVPAYFQGDLEVMNSREGKLVLAWLRYINNVNDSRALAAILADKKYPLNEIKSMTMKMDDEGHEKQPVPIDIKNLYQKLLQRKRRPNDLITTIFEHYGLNNDKTQAIVNILSSAYTGSLLTISDLIRLIEEDIELGTKYSVEPSLDIEAVTIQTMHKSKGLEYTFVIVAGLDTSVMPSTNRDKSSLIMTEDGGIRCKKQYITRVGDDGIANESIIDSWRYKLFSGGYPSDYSEDRRLLFVAMSRAKQYLTLTAHKPSNFFKHYSAKTSGHIPEAFDGAADEEWTPSPRPDLTGYSKKRRHLSPHDLMGAMPQPEQSKNNDGKGAKYGDEVHALAQMMLYDRDVKTDLPEKDEIASILDSLKGAELYPETDIVLPIDDVSIKGTADLIAVFPDRIEIHDYKTDGNEDYLSRYKLQLSIYAHAAMKYFGKDDVICSVDFLCLKKRCTFRPMDIDQIREIIDCYYKGLQKESP